MTQAKQMTLSMESMDAYMSLFGLNDQNVAVVEQECNVHVALRGNELIVSGDAENVELAVAVMEKLIGNASPPGACGSLPHSLRNRAGTGRQARFD